MKTLFSRSFIATIVALALLPLVLVNDFLIDVSIRVMLTAIAVIGLNILMGFAGQVSIGHAAFVAAGAYGSAILATHLNINPIISILVAAVGVAIFAWVIAKPILKLKGHSLTMATLGLGIIVNMILINEVNWTGGPDGMPVPPVRIGDFAVIRPLHWYWVAASTLIVSMWLSLNLFDSPAGRALRGLNGSEMAARVMGVDVGSFKTRAFVVSAVFATISGSLTAHYLAFVSPVMASFTHSVELATMVVLGGMASTYGALVGTALLTTLPQLLGGFEDFEMMFFGFILMVTMMFLPMGLVPSIARIIERRRAR
jgi:branched-chain amino acid transport system permease protein